MRHAGEKRTESFRGDMPGRDIALPMPGMGSGSAWGADMPWREEQAKQRQPCQRAWVKLWNAAAELAPSTCARDRLSFERILQGVARKIPVGAWAEGSHTESLQALVASINDTGDLHPFGAFYVSTFLGRFLEARGRLDALWERQPEILEERIPAPVIILGLPRTGTTFLFNLLARDPAHRYLRNWETTVSQLPPRKPTAMDRDPRRRIGRFLMRFQDALAPRLKDIHEFRLDGPEECTPLLFQGFATQALSGLFNAPAYARWLNSADRRPTYRHFRKILQTLQWTYPGERWLLKSPDHLGALDALLAAFPDARLIHLHRDPVQAVASWASLKATFRGIYSRHVDAETVGEQILDRLGNDMDACLQARQRHDQNRFLDLSYRELVANPLSVAERVYGHFGMELSETAQARMDAFLKADRKKKRAHRYAPEDFGLTAARIADRFQSYRARFPTLAA